MSIATHPRFAEQQRSDLVDAVLNKEDRRELKDALRTTRASIERALSTKGKRLHDMRSGRFTFERNTGRLEARLISKDGSVYAKLVATSKNGSWIGGSMQIGTPPRGLYEPARFDPVTYFLTPG